MKNKINLLFEKFLNDNIFKIFIRVLFIIYLLSSCIIKKLTEHDELRYVLILIPMIIILLVGVKKKIKPTNLDFYKETLAMSICVGILIFISGIKQIVAKDFNLSFVKDTIFMLFPFFIVFFIGNVEGKSGSKFYMRAYLLCTIFDFFLRYYDVFTFENLMSISFSESYSVFENELVNIFLPLLFYFLFVERKYFYAFLAAFFCYISMKRIHFLFIFIYIIIFVFYRLYEKKYKKLKYYNKVISYIEKVLDYILRPIPFSIIVLFFCLYPIFLDQFVLSPDFSNWFNQKFGLSLNAFTFGRENMYYAMKENLPFINGLGDSRPIAIELFGGDDMHNDLLRLYYECTYAGVVIFICTYFYISKSNKKSLLLMAYPMAVMMMSPILTSIEGMTSVYFTLFYVNLYNKNTKVGECYELFN